LAPTAHEAIAGIERLVDDVIAATDPRAWQADASPAIPGVSQPFPGDNPKTPTSEATASHWQPMAPLRRGDGEEAPFAGHAFELVSAAVFEFEP
jgi:hypothetical protein